MSSVFPELVFDNTFARELPEFYAAWNPTQVPAPRLLYFNAPLASELGIDTPKHDSQTLATVLSGNALPEGATALAQAYAGHQFGYFSPQLGDGRALLIGEVIDRQGQRRDIAFKGSGRTPFSRNGDGKAAIGPMLREVLIGEAMHALGIPSTRALAVVGTGESVYREEVLPGAVLTRIAASHIRVGTFEFFTARGEFDRVRKLTEYTIARHDPALVGAPLRVLDFLRAVAERQAALIAQWMNVGFIHGVMNTDNMTISGETIDFGPCAFMEAYNPSTVFSSIDKKGRYAYSNQAHIARWNIARLAEALLPLICDNEQHAIALAREIIDEFPQRFHHYWLQGTRAKLGLKEATAHDESDVALIRDWLTLLHENKVDFTLAWRRLADAAANNDILLRNLFNETAALDAWLARWRERCAIENPSASQSPGTAALARAQAMRMVNPWVIPRNHRVEEALAAASNDGNLEPFERLLDALKRPYEETPAHAYFAEPAPLAVTACYKTFCGT